MVYIPVCGICQCRGKKNLEEHFPHHNIVIVLLFQLLNGTAFSLVTPTIYKFITTPESRPDELKCENGTSRFWPGLGGSDTDYAWVLISYPLFEAAAMPLAGAMLHLLPFTVTIFTFLTIFIIGGVVYGLSQAVWMVFIGFGVIGAGASLGSATVHTYIGEMGTLMDNIREKQGKKPRKFLLYIAYSFMLNGGFVIPFAINSIVAQFNTEPYHWPGWMHAAFSATVGVVVLFFFVEPRTFSRHKISDMRCVSRNSNCLHSFRTRQWKIYASYVFLAACGYTVGQLYSILATLVTPVLSDQFGLNVEYTSHFLLALSTAYIISSIIQVGAKFARVDNRYLLGLCLLCAVVGSVLLGDWQSIGQDLCSRNTEQLENDSDNCSNSTIGDNTCPDDSTSNSSVLQQLVNCCEEFSSSNSMCFWNRQSRVTGEYCYTCLDVCLSKQKSHNIYQFSIGALLLCISAPLGYVFVSAIASDITSVNSQGKVVSLVLGVGSLARTVSPLWLIESYLLTERHTYFAMAISAACALVLLLSLTALYKNLAPIDRQKSDDLAVNATSALAVFGQDPPGSETEQPVPNNYDDI